MNLSVVVVEDEFSILMDITQSLELQGFNVVGSAMNYEDALLEIIEKKPDVVLLDINLNATKSGIDVAKKVNENFKIPIVFLTASSDKTTFDEASATNPMGFIIKPFKDEDLRNNIELAFKKFNSFEINKPLENNSDKEENQHLFLKHNNSFENINIDEIYYLEAMDNYTKIFVNKKCYVMSNPLKKVLSQLPEKTFIRVHKSYVISILQIKSIDNSCVSLKSGTIIPLGKAYKNEVFKQLNIIS